MLLSVNMVQGEILVQNDIELSGKGYNTPGTAGGPGRDRKLAIKSFKKTLGNQFFSREKIKIT